MRPKAYRTLCRILAIGMVFGIGINAYSIEDEKTKQEVVYANLFGDGSVDTVYVVNIATPNEQGVVTDYGQYTSVRNMSSTDEVKLDGDKITINTDQEKLYYEGTMKSAELPWNFDIKYYADGKEVSAEQIAGMTGSVEIVIDVTQNPDASSCFYENMTLQMAVTLDCDVCSGIKADGASVANIGKKKQLTFMLLPGKEQSYRLTAEAVNFEMDGILINAVLSDIDVDVNEDDILGDVSTLKDATEKLDEGAGDIESGLYDLKQVVNDDIIGNLSKLKSGSCELEDSTILLSGSVGELDGAAKELLAGAQNMQGGIAALNDGLDELGTGLDELSGQSSGLTDGSSQVYAALLQIQAALGSMPSPADVTELTVSSAQIMSAIDELTAASGQLEDAVDFDTFSAALGTGDLKAGNTSTISAINAQIAQLSATPGNEETISVLTAAANMLVSNNAHIDGTQSYFDTLEANAGLLYSGLADLQTQYGAFDTALRTAAAELEALPLALAQLSASVDALVMQYAGLNDGIVEYVDGVALAQGGCDAAKAGMPELVSGSCALAEGLAELSNGTSQLKTAAAELSFAMSSFDDGVLELAEGMNELNSGVTELYDGSQELYDGTHALNEEAQGMDSAITEEIDEMLSSISGNPEDIISFVSEKNTNVTGVQFVIKTPPIKMQEIVKATAQPIEKKTFWQKLMMLFGIE